MSRHYFADYRVSFDQPGNDATLLFGGKILVDGKEIHSCTFIDTMRGIVHSWDIFGDGRMLAHRMGDPELNDPPPWPIFYEHGDPRIASIQIKGSIEIFDSNNVRLYP